ncbi:DUF4376 domain-containing protein [Brucella sp. 2280]|uniref:DUF4376 domain-containing protein n=1 Tax=Brucella sp. 2280 TaxID=2592625 RepID=UPI001294D742|nr:DUF4376 domain-containing protein [Brucella sp. 2280]QGA57780.1 DUF4376 domain-containing protein [Brucella sp. 2280]
MFERAFAYVRKENNGYFFKYKGDEHESYVSDNAVGNTDFHNIEKWIADGNVPEVPATPAINLKDYTANARWQKEVGGINYMGMPISTDDRSKVMISGARVAAEADPNFTTQWKGADGSFATLDAATIFAISTAVSDHVSNCFALESHVVAQIEAGAITTTQEIDAAFA